MRFGHRGDDLEVETLGQLIEQGGTRNDRQNVDCAADRERDLGQRRTAVLDDLDVEILPREIPLVRRQEDGQINVDLRIEGDAQLRLGALRDCALSAVEKTAIAAVAFNKFLRSIMALLL